MNCIEICNIHVSRRQLLTLDSKALVNVKFEGNVYNIEFA